MSQDKKDTPLSPEELSGIAGGTYEHREGTQGDDTIAFWDNGSGDDDGSIVHAGAGNDVVDAGGYADNIVYGEEGDDDITGGYGNDVLDGGTGDDTLDGGGHGDDYLNGGEGNDVLDGGTGDDTLIGGTGDDTITGGEGADSFVFDRASGSDVVTDFNPDEDTFQFMGVRDADEFEVQVDGDGNTVISFGDTTITVQGVELTHDQVAELAGFSIDEPASPGR